MDFLKEILAKQKRELELCIWATAIYKEYTGNNRDPSLMVFKVKVHPLGRRELIDSDKEDGWTLEELDSLISRSILLYTTKGDKCEFYLYSCAIEEYVVVNSDICSFYVRAEDLDYSDITDALRWLRKQKHHRIITKIAASFLLCLVELILIFL
ncbi:hypothetical protein [Bacillus toyonensis]|uniref:hypothetical protein n=1 Tax=Bacillus toyonensis TaxID=155322 RepID=UPI002E20DAD1|nr:hypothetical protein [Bacillus toyonensis]